MKNVLALSIPPSYHVTAARSHVDAERLNEVVFPLHHHAYGAMSGNECCEELCGNLAEKGHSNAAESNREERYGDIQMNNRRY